MKRISNNQRSGVPVETLAPLPLFIRLGVVNYCGTLTIRRSGTMLLNVRREAYQKFLQTPVHELMKDSSTLEELKNNLLVEEDLDYIIVADRRLWQDFLRHTDDIDIVMFLKASFLENAVFKFSNAEVTAKLSIPDEIYEEVSL